MASGEPPLRLCVVDDAPVLRALFAQIAAVLGHTIVAAESHVSAALERVRALAPSVLIVDGRLRATDVPDFVRRTRAEMPALRILVVASLEETALVAAATAAGAAGVVRRPLSRAQVRDALRGAR